MDGWMDGWVGGWMDELMDGWMDGCVVLMLRGRRHPCRCVLLYVFPWLDEGLNQTCDGVLTSAMCRVHGHAPWAWVVTTSLYARRLRR
jgi:hypothetical protein